MMEWTPQLLLPIMRRRIRRKRQVIFLSGVTKMVENDTRLYARYATVGIYRKDVPHVLCEVENHCRIAALSCQGGSSSATEEGHAEFTADRDRSDHIIGITRKNHADR